MSAYNEARRRQVNDRPIRPGGRYVLYWSQMYRRLNFNHALDFALEQAIALRRPLVVYEGLRLGYPWASARFHTFVLQGMAEQVERAREIGINYWPFVETPGNTGAGLLRQLAIDACLIVTDDYPAFIAPRQTAALALRSQAAVVAVDGNSVVPLKLLGPAISAAAHLRPRIHRNFSEAWAHRAVAEPVFPKEVRAEVAPPFPLWRPDDVERFVNELPIDHSVSALPGEPGGTRAGGRRLRQFIDSRLSGYAERRSPPTAPDQGHASELSGYLHFGQIGIEQVVDAVLKAAGGTTPNEAMRGKREGFYCDDPDANSFLDEAITWRDVGFQWHYHRAADATQLSTALPEWAKATLNKHRQDRREYLYTPEQWESAATHDPLWNAAQTELVHTGRIQNYLRMLWGKKVIEWSETPEEAYRTLEHLNNKYAIDGRDPNSYTGILWCFGLFDRPWAPERKVLGTIRYMSSANTAKKFKIQGYLDYVHGLGGTGRSGSLF